MGIYSKYDTYEQMVVPKCIRDYTGEVKDWINYTTQQDNSRRKTFFVCDETDKNIAKYCVEKLGNGIVAAAIYQIMIAIKADNSSRFVGANFLDQDLPRLLSS
jgi:hypothetical protein